MIAQFLKGTPYSKTEIEMQIIPGGHIRRSGTFREHRRSNFLPYVPYYSALQMLASEVTHFKLALRIEKILNESEENPMMFRSAEHKKRFQGLVKSGFFEALEIDPAYASAIFLLSSDSFLWTASKPFIEKDKIRFQEICIKGVDLDGYTIFHMAKELYAGQMHLSLSELGDPDLIPDCVLRLLVNAFVVRRHGLSVSSFGKETNKRQTRALPC